MSQGPLARYRALIGQDEFSHDATQERAVRRLDGLWQELQAPAPASWLRSLLRRNRQEIRGFYLWGGVGRGKTWMMDLFFESLTLHRKQRIHFHRFMARVHAALRERASEKNPLVSIARDWASRCQVLCFDEFFVSDIADAMLLAGLLEVFFENGVVLVATSNTHPDDLYAEGLQRARFLPAIELIKQFTHVLHIDGDTDYRLRILERSKIYLHPQNEQSLRRMSAAFERFAGGCDLDPELLINSRVLAARKRGDGVIWFDFPELCEQPRSVDDYIELSMAFNTVLLSGLRAMDDVSNDAARRFINLVDEFYDRNVKLLINADIPVDDIYSGEKLAFEFNRTRSRLTEMQSHEYLARPHLP